MTARFPLIAIAAAILLPGAALAHPKLLSTMPAAGASVAAPTRVELKFSETLIAKLTAGSLTLTAMGGKPHPAMAIGGVASSVTADGKTLVLALARPLAAGSYRVDWHAVSTDTHRVAGKYAFTVR